MRHEHRFVSFRGCVIIFDREAYFNDEREMAQDLIFVPELEGGSDRDMLHGVHRMTNSYSVSGVYSSDRTSGPMDGCVHCFARR